MTSGQGDKVTLALPRGADFRRVALLVVGGLAVRLDLTLESLEDLQIAVESMLERGEAAEGATLELQIGDGSITVLVGPVNGTALRSELEREDLADQVSLRRVLQTVTDGFEVVERDGSSWLQVDKRVEGGGDGE